MDYRHLVWVVFGALAGFFASFIFGDLFHLPLDLYYFIYFLTVAILFAAYIRKTRLNLRELFSKRLVWGILLGLVFGAAVVRNVLSRPATARLAGLYLIWQVVWRGLFYGTIDGLLLSVFPWIVTWRAFDLEKKGLGRRIVFSFLTWIFIILITTAYHFGYSDFRSNKIMQANIGNTIMSLPTLLSANPVGAPIAHAALHIAAVIHTPETEVFLPPHRK